MGLFSGHKTHTPTHTCVLTLAEYILKPLVDKLTLIIHTGARTHTHTHTRISTHTHTYRHTHS